MRIKLSKPPATHHDDRGKSVASSLCKSICGGDGREVEFMVDERRGVVCGWAWVRERRSRKKRVSEPALRETIYLAAAAAAVAVAAGWGWERKSLRG